MTTKCAWCGAEMSPSGAKGGPITHGMCTSCEEALEYSRLPVQEFLESLDGPVMLVDTEGRAACANSRFGELVGQSPTSMAGRLSGDIISCIYARLPEGCGQTEHCVGCTIRNAVNFARASGVSRVSAPAYAFVHTPDGPVRMSFRISLERVASHSVLMRIDGAAPYTQPQFSATGSEVPTPTVLVVDDDDATRRFLARALSAAGCRVVQSSNGRDATEAAVAQQVDIVLTDLVMPEQEGIETVMRLRRLRPNLGIVAISGAFNGGMLEAARLLGADATLQKPVTPQELWNVVQSVWSSRTAR